MIEKEELDIVYKKNINSDDPNELFSLMENIIYFFDEEKLNDFISKKKSVLLKNDSIRFIENHIYFYLNQDKYQKGLDVLEFYMQEPFINLSTEEFMKELHQKICDKLNPNKHSFTFDYQKMEEVFLSNNEDKILSVVKHLSEINIRKHLPFIEKMLLSSTEYRFKILLQFILVEQSIDKEIFILNGNEKFSYNPSKALLPFDTKEYKNAENYLKKLNESPSVVNMAIQIMNTTLVRIYPTNILKKYDNPYILCEIFVFLAKDYLQEKVNILSLKKNTDLEIDELNEIIDYLTKILA